MYNFHSVTHVIRSLKPPHSWMEFNILVIDDKALKLWLLTLIWSAEPTMIVVNWCFSLIIDDDDAER